MSRRSSDSLIFDTLRLEGGLFVPALLEKAARGEHTEQKAADYRLPKGLSLADEQGRAFRIAGALWKAIQPVRERTDVDAHRATLGFASELLRDALGYSDFSGVPDPVDLGGRLYPIHALIRGRVPVVVAPHDLDLDTPDERFAVIGSGSRRKSAYQLAQQFLNANADCTWALVTNGRQLRLLRDADTLTRPAYLEFDLESILRDGGRYADFAALWRLLHASRAGDPATPGSDCPWERWKREGEAQGERVREGLRLGVTDALLALGDGFLQHRDNDALRRRLEAGDLTVDAYFQQLLRLVYRFLFLFTVEERGLLHAPDDSPEARRARELYAQGYAMRRLRDRALRRAGFDRFADRWAAVRITFRGLATGEPRLALPALGGLFAPTQCPDLDNANLDNRALLTVMRHLRWSSGTGTLAAVDYRNMGPEELGSVYESLLELVPTVDIPARRFGFAGLTDEESSDGNARKKTGSYYTPDSLVQELLDSTLDPVIAARVAACPEDPARALLEITVVDPACGSGHFLLGAARRLAEKLAELRAVEGAVQPTDYRHALREVIAHCIYGVDRNPLAIELARTALWLEGHEPDRPLSFLGHHLVCGDALLGLTDLRTLTAGIAPDAFKPLSGDDKTVCKELATDNRAALKELDTRVRDKTRMLFDADSEDTLFALLEQIETAPDLTPGDVARQEADHARFLEQVETTTSKRLSDLVIAAYVTPKSDADALTLCPTTRTLLQVAFPERDQPIPSTIINHAQDLCREATVLHWPIHFQPIFQRGGFDCVLGNPPWERIKLQEEEFFASREPLIASAKNKAERGQRIQWLAEGSLAYHLHGTDIPHGGNRVEIELYREFITARRLAEASSQFAHVNGINGGRFPLTGVGDVNTYALFAETISQIVNPSGRAGFIVPTGIATDDSTKAFFAQIAEGGRLASLFDFENRQKLFSAVDSRVKFCLMALGPADATDFAFFLTQTEQLADERRHFVLTPEEFRLINPNTRTCPVFRSKADAELTKKIYRRVPVLIEEAREGEPEKNPWGISFSTMFHMSNDSGLFLDQPGANALPLHEAKMMHQFDHRWATYQWDDTSRAPVVGDINSAQKVNPKFTANPRYWVPEHHVLARLARAPRCVRQAWEAQDERALLIAFATWIEAGHELDSLAGFSVSTARNRVIEIGGPCFDALPTHEDDWLSDKAVAEARAHTPLDDEELQLLYGTTDLFTAARTILDRRSPRWLMGWRDICRATDERTVIASVVPRAGVGNNLPLMLFDGSHSTRFYAALLGNLCSLSLDFVARHKVGGTHLNYFIYKQLPVHPPSTYSEADLDFIVPRVLELTYTSHDLAAWAADLGHTGDPFKFDPDRRAILRAELDVYYARLYGLTRDELRYILDPADTHGADYPTETFRGLKNNDIKNHGHYRTQRLVLEAWDALAEDNLIEVAQPRGRPSMSEEDYLLELIPALLREGDEGWLEWETLVHAVKYLAKPNKLVSSAVDDDAESAREWMATQPPGFDLGSVVPAIRELGGENLRIERTGSKRYLILLHEAAPESESAVKNDARMAMRVVRSASIMLPFELDEIAFNNSFEALEEALT